ncbi:MAG: alpha/beta hydrolase [Anaeromyxobacteraceae bacterium]
MKAGLVRWMKRGAILAAVVVVTLFVGRVVETQRGPPLRVWHTWAPEEMTVEELEKGDWAAYVKHEAALFDRLTVKLKEELEPEDRVPANRYFDGSPIYPPRFDQDWNRSYVLEPDGAPVGAVVFLHGLTDSPYSLRHIARRYRAEGWVAVAPRLPAHGTVPAALSTVQWEEWVAATRLAVREARRRAGPGTPLHIVGFSNGGALALMYALDALGDKSLARPDRLILISPMIGVTSFARFAGLAGLPAVLPRFAKAAWLSNLPEFNPFKYNSFPVNGATQSHRLTQVLQSRIARYEREGRLAEIAPVLTFQSVLDFTVHTRAIIDDLYARLPKNGSELVLFDLNRAALLSPLLRSSMETLVERMLPDPPRNYRLSLLTNAGRENAEEVVRVTEAGQTATTVRPLGLYYPQDVFSLSHVALPFPPWDALYGMAPDGKEDYGIALGTMAGRGERGALIVSLDALLRVSSNPFFDYAMERIDEGIVPRRTTPAAR